MPDKLPGRRFSPRPTAHKGEGWDWAAGYCSAMAWACAHGLELFYEPRLERRRVDLHLLFSQTPEPVETYATEVELWLPS